MAGDFIYNRESISLGKWSLGSLSRENVATRPARRFKSRSKKFASRSWVWSKDQKGLCQAGLHISLSFLSTRSVVVADEAQSA
jgi:hypothetical protein